MYVCMYVCLTHSFCPHLVWQKWRLAFYKLATHKYFDPAIITAIVINVMVMMVYFDRYMSAGACISLECASGGWRSFSIPTYSACGGASMRTAVFALCLSSFNVPLFFILTYLSSTHSFF